MRAPFRNFGRCIGILPHVVSRIAGAQSPSNRRANAAVQDVTLNLLRDNSLEWRYEPVAECNVCLALRSADCEQPCSYFARSTSLSNSLLSSGFSTCVCSSILFGTWSRRVRDGSLGERLPRGSGEPGQRSTFRSDCLSGPVVSTSIPPIRCDCSCDFRHSSGRW